MRGTFGWDLPPGVTQRHIDEACGEAIDPREVYGDDYEFEDSGDEEDEKQ